MEKLRICKNNDGSIHLLDISGMLLGTLVYKTTPLIQGKSLSLVWALKNAEIIIDNQKYEIRHTFKQNFIGTDHLLTFLDDKGKQLSNIKWYVGSRTNDGFANLTCITTLEGREYSYNISTDKRIFSPYRSWFTKNNVEVVKIGPAELGKQEYEISTDLPLSDINTKLLALWGYYLLPRGLNKKVPKVAFFLVILIFVLFAAFAISRAL